jgi:hypothetical protein
MPICTDPLHGGASKIGHGCFPMRSHQFPGTLSWHSLGNIKAPEICLATND